MGFGNFAGFDDFIERSGIGDAGFHISACCSHAHHEAFVVFDGVSGFNRSDNADDFGFGHFGGQYAHDISAFLRLRVISEDVRSALETGSVCKRNLWELRSDFFHNALILGAVGNDNVKALCRILTNGGSGIHRFAHAFTDGQLNAIFRLGLHFFQCFIHGLGPGHIIHRAGQHQGDFEFLGFGSFGFLRGLGLFLCAAAAGNQQG